MLLSTSPDRCWYACLHFLWCYSLGPQPTGVSYCWLCAPCQLSPQLLRARRRCWSTTVPCRGATRHHDYRCIWNAKPSWSHSAHNCDHGSLVFDWDLYHQCGAVQSHVLYQQCQPAMVGNLNIGSSSRTQVAAQRTALQARDPKQRPMRSC
jgi:hypothetical protein